MKFLQKLKGLRKLTEMESLDELLEVCASAGIDVKVDKIPAEPKPTTAELEGIAEAAISSGAQFIKVEWKSKQDSAVAFIVLKKAVL